MVPPSSIARLVLSYLEEKGLSQTAKTFEDESNELEGTRDCLLDPLTASLREVVEDYLMLKEIVISYDHDDSNSVWPLLWKKFDQIVGQLKFASKPPSPAKKVRTKLTGRRRLIPVSKVNSKPELKNKTLENATRRNTVSPSQPVPGIPPDQLCYVKTVTNPFAGSMQGNLDRNTNFYRTDVPLMPFHEAVPANSMSDVSSRMAHLRRGFLNPNYRIPRVSPSGLAMGQKTAESSGTISTVSSSFLQELQSNHSSPMQHSVGSTVTHNQIPMDHGDAAEEVIDVGCEVVQPVAKSDTQAISLDRGTLTVIQDGVTDSEVQVIDEGNSQAISNSPEIDMIGGTTDPRASANHASIASSQQLEHQLGKSPRRKGHPPRKRSANHSLVSPSKFHQTAQPPSSSQHTGNDENSSDIAGAVVPIFLDTFLNAPVLQEKLAANINKVRSAKSSDASHEPVAPSTAEEEQSSGSDQNTDAQVSHILSMLESDPAFEELFAGLCSDSSSNTPSKQNPVSVSSSTVTQSTEVTASTVASSAANGVVLTETQFATKSLNKIRPSCKEPAHLNPLPMTTETPPEIQAEMTKDTPQHVRSLDFSKVKVGEEAKPKSRRRGPRKTTARKNKENQGSSLTGVPMISYDPPAIPSHGQLILNSPYALVGPDPVLGPGNVAPYMIGNLPVTSAGVFPENLVATTANQFPVTGNEFLENAPGFQERQSDPTPAANMLKMIASSAKERGNGDVKEGTLLQHLQGAAILQQMQGRVENYGTGVEVSAAGVQGSYGGSHISTVGAQLSATGMHPNQGLVQQDTQGNWQLLLQAANSAQQLPGSIHPVATSSMTEHDGSQGMLSNQQGAVMSAGLPGTPSTSVTTSSTSRDFDFQRHSLSPSKQPLTGNSDDFHDSRDNNSKDRSSLFHVISSVEESVLNVGQHQSENTTGLGSCSDQGRGSGQGVASHSNTQEHSPLSRKRPENPSVLHELSPASVVSRKAEECVSGFLSGFSSYVSNKIDSPTAFGRGSVTLPNVHTVRSKGSVSKHVSAFGVTDAGLPSKRRDHADGPKAPVVTTPSSSGVCGTHHAEMEAPQVDGAVSVWCQQGVSPGLVSSSASSKNRRSSPVSRSPHSTTGTPNATGITSAIPASSTTGPPITTETKSSVEVPDITGSPSCTESPSTGAPDATGKPSTTGSSSTAIEPGEGVVDGGEISKGRKRSASTNNEENQPKRVKGPKKSKKSKRKKSDGKLLPANFDVDKFLSSLHYVEK
ncbi:uncharacterized protein LOC5501699 isoform X2 [Nematostella vectensis]|uniref:uncharacterized protein LOC5501699 isoform X2 n=1 Tax=Nematostella vectensis TaxID=45351 RepID=UPI0020773A1C|nr:uncharacterized protein LOC5501699 isoform X2 [Nematostella vectensis]